MFRLHVYPGGVVGGSRGVSCVGNESFMVGWRPVGGWNDVVYTGESERV